MIYPLKKPIYHDEKGTHPVDALSAGQFGEISSPGRGFTSEEGSLWAKRLTELLSYQFPDVSSTRATSLVWEKDELIGVIGIRSPFRLPEGHLLVSDFGLALYRIHQMKSLQQELKAYQYLAAHSDKSLIIVREDGGILTGSVSGWDALHRFLRVRPSKKNPVTDLPPLMKAALEGRRSRFGSLDLEVVRLPGEVVETVAPLFVAFLIPQVKPDTMSMDQRILTLTVSQKVVYQLMLAGSRNKEIATELGISINTVIHHVSSVLHKLGCMDRLQLMARSVEQPTPRKIILPPLAAVPPMVQPEWYLPRKTGTRTRQREMKT